MLKTIVAVVVAGIVGTIANSAAITAAFGAPFVPLAISPGRNLVAILVAALLPLIYGRLTGAAAHLVALLALTVIPSVLAKTVFAAQAPWLAVLLLNGVYALAAIVVYLLITRGAETRQARLQA